MRPTTLNSAQYNPGDPPADPQQLQRFLREEFVKLKAAVNALALGHLDVTTVAPTKPREGDWRIADGVLWNPLGTGKGPVWYDATAVAWKAF